MRLKNITQNLKEIFFFRKLVKKYGAILRRGRYNLLPSMRALVLNDDNVQSHANNYFYKNISLSKTTKLISALNKLNFYHNNSKQQVGQYDAIYVANNYDKIREIKFFSFEKNEILTICVSSDSCNEQLVQYEKLGKYFNMPKVEKFELYENSIKVKMINKLDRPNEKLALKAIIESFSAYSKSNFCGSQLGLEIVKFDYEDERIVSTLNKYSTLISEDIKNVNFPTLLQHGDLSRDNLMYGSIDDNKCFWWIDWEHLKERYFLYDFFFYALNTAIYFEDYTAFNLYVNGECDEMLKEYFKLFRLEYNSNYRKDYFMIFFIEFLKERVCSFNNASALETYCSFLDGVTF